MSRDLEEILEQLKNQGDVEEEPRLNADEQQRIFQMAMKKINEQEKSKKKNYSGKQWGKRVVAAAAVIVALSMGSVAAAAVIHWNLNEKFSRFFGTQECEQKENTVPVQNLKIASQEIDHIKVTADQVIGDEHSMYVLFHLTGVSPDKTNLIFKDIEVNVDADDYVVSNPVCSGYENDNPYYILEVRTSNDLSGKPISLKMGSVGYLDETDQYQVLTRGGYHLSWNLNYQIKTRKVEVNKPIHIYGGTANVDYISISPLSVTINLRDIKLSEKETMQPNDRLRVVMKNGVIYDSYRMDSGTVLNDYDQISLGLHHIVKESDIQEIQFAGITIPLHANPNVEKEYRYENDKMGITVDLPEKLYHSVKPQKMKSYQDDYSKCKIDEVHFIGTVDKTKLDMFIVSRYHKVMSESEFEKVCPLAMYVTSDDQYTYSLQITEELPEKHQEEFAELINDYVVNLLPRINTKSNQ